MKTIEDGLQRIAGHCIAADCVAWDYEPHHAAGMMFDEHAMRALGLDELELHRPGIGGRIPAIHARNAPARQRFERNEGQSGRPRRAMGSGPEVHLSA